MRTRNAGVAKPPVQAPAPKKRTPTTRKTSARKAAATPVEESTPELVTPTSADTPSPAIEPESSEPAIEQEKASAEVVVTPPTKVTPASKKKATKTKKVVKKVVRSKTPASAKTVSANTDEVPEAEDVKADQGQKGEDVTDAKVEQSLKAEEEVPKVSKSDEQEEREEDLGDAQEKGKIKMDVDDLFTTDSKAEDEVPKVTKPNKKEEREGDLGGDQDKGKHKMDVDGLSITDSKAEEEVPKITKPDEQEETEGDLGDTRDKGKDKMDVDDLFTADARIAEKTDSTVAEDINKSAEDSSNSTEGQQLVACEEPIKEVSATADMLESEKEPEGCQDKMDDDQKQENIEVDNQKSVNLDDGQTEKAEKASQVKDNAPVSDKIEGYGDEEGFVEPGEEDLREDDEPEPEPEPETTDDGEALNDENKEMAAAAKEGKIKKEHEIFVGGLDREVGEEDIKNAFEKVGEVVEVRLLKFPNTNKSRGFAFVRFATKDQAKKALSEMKNPVICGKQCGTAPNDENDTLFVGNICNTWTKEAISQKLKDYNVQGVENITLVQDPRHEGLSRGFCFVQFACHADAMSAYKKLQKPDVVFGHAERSAKVAIAEPLPEPDPEVMAKVKSVFIDGLPPYWDEDSVRKHFNSYGEITRVTLARNMSSAKRKDFGFVDYTTHEAAMACIDDVNKKELGDGNSKAKVRARLSNPSPKMQAVKGGMRGGFQIGHPSGRSLGRPAPPVNRPSYQYHRGPRAPFVDPIAVGPYVQRAPHRGGHGVPRGSGVGRPNFSGPRHGLIERGPVRPIPPQREPFPINSGVFPRPFMGRPYNDPYLDDRQGLKRPFYMTEQDPAYIEPTRVRARYDYTNLGRGSSGGVGRGSHGGVGHGSHVGVGHGSHVGDAFAAGGSTYPSGYYGPDYGARPVRPPPSFNSRGRPYGGGPSGRGGGGNGPSGYYY